EASTTARQLASASSASSVSAIARMSAMSKKLLGGRLISRRATDPDVSTPRSGNEASGNEAIGHSFHRLVLAAKPLAGGAIVRHRPQAAGAVLHVGEERTAGFAQELDAGLGRLRIAPNQDRLCGLTRKLMQRLAVAQQQTRIASGDDEDHPVD